MKSNSVYIFPSDLVTKRIFKYSRQIEKALKIFRFFLFKQETEVNSSIGDELV